MKSRDFKQIALDALKGNWFIAVIAGFIASLLGGMTVNGGGITFSFPAVEPEQGGNMNETVPINVVGNDVIIDFLLTILAALLIVSAIYAVLQLIVGSAVGIGYAQFNMDMIGGYKPKISTMFSCFDQLKTAICAKLLTLLRVFVGMILFIIPGIVMAYSYAMVNFVMAEHPEYNAREALRESKRIMKGNRWRLFCLEMSFLGWVFLSLFALGIPLLWVVPYQQAAFAAFYIEARNNA